MPTIRSIIIFNGGSAGDFLRTVCLEQLIGFDRYRIDDTGMIDTSIKNNYIKDNYFKELCKAEQKLNQHQPVDLERCFEIENAHSYYDWFQDLTSNLFYIHYEDSMSAAIVQAFIHKRKMPDFDNWVQTMLPHIPVGIMSRVNQDNLADVLSIFWKKNIQSWQSNSKLIPIPFRDLVDQTGLTKWVERLCNQPLSDPARLAQTQQAWLDKNSALASALL